MRSNRNKTANSVIDTNIVSYVVNRIKLHFTPEKIILFGSQAWGKPDKESDVDLFVVMDSDLRRDERSRVIQKLFSDRTFPLDIIVYTPKEVKESLEKGNPFIKEIIKEGKLLHG